MLLVRCLRPAEADYILCEVHEGICESTLKAGCWRTRSFDEDTTSPIYTKMRSSLYDVVIAASDMPISSITIGTPRFCQFILAISLVGNRHPWSVPSSHRVKKFFIIIIDYTK